MARESTALKRLTVLHANDLHGRLLFQVDKNMVLRGGISMMGDYIKSVRACEKRVFFSISGDVLQEDLRGSDYKGVNTVELINRIHPDAISLGNHEMDYGLAHLLVFKACIEVPVLNANIIVSPMHKHLFQSSLVQEMDGIRMLVIGLIPQSFFNIIESDEFCRNMLSYRDSHTVIREVLQMHKGEIFDVVVLMSHYGLEGDRSLAEQMPPDCHVDVILGGHSHIEMSEPEVVNGILIAQSAFGTEFIGRFDFDVDTENHRIDSWRWERVAITSENCNFDTTLEDLTDRVLGAWKPVREERIGSFASVYRHESRLFETELGDIVADAFQEIYDVDLVMLQSGSIRQKECSGNLTEAGLRKLFPYDDEFIAVRFTGKELQEMMACLFTPREGEAEPRGYFQYSRGFEMVVDFAKPLNERIQRLSLYGEELEEDKIYQIGITRNCEKNFFRYFCRQIETYRIRTLSLSTFNDLARWFLARQNPVSAPPKGRLILLHYKGKSPRKTDNIPRG